MSAYFDCNATTPLRPSAREAMLEGLDQFWANPSSPYSSSARVRNELESARERLAGSLQTTAQNLVFTGGATEANNLVIEFLSWQGNSEHHVLLSPFEHPSVVDAARHYWDDRIRFLRSDKNGAIDLDDFRSQIQSSKIGAVSVMAVNNESGVIQPLREISEGCRKAGVYYHCDASQWFGKLPVSEVQFGDFIVGCGHKFGGPKGVGFIALSDRGAGFRSQFGGGQESGRRGGTENVPSIMAMVNALSVAETELSAMTSQAVFRDRFEAELLKYLPTAIVAGQAGHRVANTSFVILPDYENIRWVRKLDIKGFQVSTGSACSTGKTATSLVVQALGYTPHAGRRTIRISSWSDTSEQDWTDLTQAFVEVWEDLRSRGESGKTEVISI